jgi:hypothetical protein
VARGSLNAIVMFQLAATGPTGATGPLGGAVTIGTLTAIVVVGAAILTVVLVILGTRAARRVGAKRRVPQDDPITESVRRNEERHPEAYDSRREQHPGPPPRWSA